MNAIFRKPHYKHLYLTSAALLCALVSSEATANGGLFNNNNDAMSTPINRRALPKLEQPAQAAETASAPSKGPLRIIIPNIQHAEKPETSAKKPARIAKKHVPVPDVAAVTEAVPAAKANIAQPIITSTATAVSLDNLAPAAGKNTASTTAQNSYHYAMELLNDVYSNAVILSFLNVNAASYTKVPLTPAPLPTAWVVAADISIENLAPAAGKATPTPITPNQVIVPNVTATEPEPTLSEKSKDVLEGLPALAKKTTPKGGKVDIDRETEKGDFGGNVSVNTHEAMGIKMAMKRPKIDLTFMLEKAYNALLGGQTEAAIEIYQDILTNEPKNKDALFGLATTYHRVGQLDLARGLYAKLLEIDPNYRDGLNNFLVLLSEEAPNEALEKMRDLEQKNPGFSPIPAQMAIIYQKQGNTEKAIDKMYNALALAPENITYRYNLAVLLDKQGNYEQASTLYQQVLDSAAKGVIIPSDANKIQQRLTFIRSNGSR